MVHVFNYKDKNYIYDSGSGSLHECDEKTAAYLKGNTANLSAAEISEIEKDVALPCNLFCKRTGRYFCIRRNP